MKNDPKKDAGEVLKAYWAEGRFPVDPAMIAVAMGLDVKIAKLPENISGAIYKRTGADPVILLEESDHKNRQRFTCAHELGHYVRRSDDADFSYADYRGIMASQGTDKEEVYANEFAANLLMPEDAVREEHRRGEKPVWLLAKKFGVSPDAMKWRLTNLKLEVHG